MHITKDKADLATAMVIADLLKLGFSPSIPFSDHLPYDLIVDIGDRLVKVQVKYMATLSTHIKDLVCCVKSGSSQRHRHYTNSDFDYYAIYLADKECVIYPSILFGGTTIRSTLPDIDRPFVWYEDFLDKGFVDSITKRTLNEFNAKPKKQTRKSKIIDREKLIELVDTMPVVEIAKLLSVSDRCVSKWIEKYGIEKKPAGYWLASK